MIFFTWTLSRNVKRLTTVHLFLFVVSINVKGAEEIGKGIEWPDYLQFEAGSFLITQDAFDEAPYRYTHLFEKILNKIEAISVPSVTDEKNCSVQYKIRPSEKESVIKLVDNSLRIKLQQNNSLILSVVLDSQVWAKTWISKGKSLGFLGCIKISTCKGQEVRYSARLHLDILIKVELKKDPKTKSHGLFLELKPLESTDLSNVTVDGCHPPWYIKWLRIWQKLLNEGVENGLKSLAYKFEHKTSVPQVFSPVKNVIIRYFLTKLVWSERFVTLHANATLAVVLNDAYLSSKDRNISNENVIFYRPKNREFDHIKTNEFTVREVGKDLIESTSTNVWGEIVGEANGRDDVLLQGVRLSTQFFNCLMWYATKTRKTRVRGATNILDSYVEGGIDYASPVIRIVDENSIGIHISQGRVRILCTPRSIEKQNVSKGNKTSTMFETRFTSLSGTGYIDIFRRNRKLNSTSKSGLSLGLVLTDIDLSSMKMNPIIPKVPLPQNLETDVMERYVTEHFIPVLNGYLSSKLALLPKSLDLFIANPNLRLVKPSVDRDGRRHTGLIEILSFCSCGDDDGHRKNNNECHKDSLVCRSRVEKHLGRSKRSSDESKSWWGLGLDVLHMGSKIISTIMNKKKQVDRGEGGSIEKNARDKSNIQRIKDDKDSDVSTIEPELSETGQRKAREIVWRNESIHSQKVEETKLFEYIDGTKCSVHEIKDNFKTIMIDNDGKQEVVKREIKSDGKRTNYENTNLIITLTLILIFTLIICLIILGRVFTVSSEKISTAEDRQHMRSLFGFRLTHMVKHVSIAELLDNLLHVTILTVNSIMVILFADSWRKSINPIMMFVDKLEEETASVYNSASPHSNGTDTRPWFDRSSLKLLIWRLNTFMYWSHMTCGSLSLMLVTLWLVTRESNSRYKDLLEKYKVRIMWNTWYLYASCAMLFSAFIVISTILFANTHFDKLVLIDGHVENFVTTNPPLLKLISKALRCFINGSSIVVLSGTVVFLFNGVSGGIYCGSVLFKLCDTLVTKYADVTSQTAGKVVRPDNNLSMLMTLTTVIQPFICLHPTIIWIQHSSINGPLVTSMVQLLWFLPMIFHLTRRSIRYVTQQKELRKLDKKTVFYLHQKHQTTDEFANQNEDECNETINNTNCDKIGADFYIEFMQMLTYVGVFVTITYYIATLESVGKDITDLKHFILPTIATTFMSALSVSFFTQSLSMSRIRFQTLHLITKLESRNHVSIERSSVERSVSLATVLSTVSSSTSNDTYNSKRLEENKVDTGLQIINNASVRNKKIQNFIQVLLETKEYANPHMYGWRIKYRRLFLTLGVVSFTIHTISDGMETSEFRAKVYIHELVQSTTQSQLNWPIDGETVLDKAFHLYNVFQRLRLAILVASNISFIISLLADVMAVGTKQIRNNRHYIAQCLSVSRVFNLLGTFCMFVSIILVSIPDYLSASDIQQICPFCGENFNKVVKTSVHFFVGLCFAALFTFQSLPVLLTIVPALIRASALMQIHPTLTNMTRSYTNQLLSFKLQVLRRVMLGASIVSFPLTFLPMVVIQQYNKSLIVTLLIMSFWTLPPLVIYIGNLVENKISNKADFNRYIYLAIYYTYSTTYFLFLFFIIVCSVGIESTWSMFIQYVSNLTFWTSGFAEIFLCNVVISDVLYITIF